MSDVTEQQRPMTPPWEKIHHSFDWVAMDADGRVTAFWNKPHPDFEDNRWQEGFGDALNITHLEFDRGNLPWDQSRVGRRDEAHATYTRADIEAVLEAAFWAGRSCRGDAISIGAALKALNIDAVLKEAGE